MGSVGVVVLGIDAKHQLDVSTPEDEKSIQALAPQRADKAFRDGVRERSPDRGADDLDALGPKDLIERPCVLRVAVADQEPERVRLTVD